MPAVEKAILTEVAMDPTRAELARTELARADLARAELAMNPTRVELRG
jgi:hypothetical protein